MTSRASSPTRRRLLASVVPVTTFVTVGAGWRAQYFWRAATGLPQLQCVGAVVRSQRASPVPVFTSLQECVRVTRPDFAVTATPKAATASVIAELVSLRVPVLAETPPAPDLDGLRALWAEVGSSALVQVAEQYLLMPSHAARAALVRSGVIGVPTQVQVSSTHQYHAVSLMRGLLGVGSGPVSVTATRTIAPLVDPINRDGWTDDLQPRPATTTLATIDFGDGRSGLYDFTDNQWHNQLRFRRILVRGSHGELQDDEVTHLTKTRTILRTPLVRRQTGYDLDLDGFETEHIAFGTEVLYRNPYLGRRWNDEEIAIATLLDRMAAWVQGHGPAPYPLADGMQDHRIALAVDEAAESGCTVRTSSEPWPGDATS